MPAYKHIKRRRLELKLSQEQLATRLRPYLPVLTKKVISKIENQERKVYADELPYIAKALECWPEELIDNVEDSE